jgi:hypothetical protein
MLQKARVSAHYRPLTFGNVRLHSCCRIYVANGEAIAQLFLCQHNYRNCEGPVERAMLSSGPVPKHHAIADFHNRCSAAGRSLIMKLRKEAGKKRECIIASERSGSVGAALAEEETFLALQCSRIPALAGFGTVGMDATRVDAI